MSLVEQYKASGLSETDAYYQAGQDIISGNVDIAGLFVDQEADATPEVTPAVTPETVAQTTAEVVQNQNETAPLRDETAYEEASTEGLDSGLFPIQSSLGNFTVPADLMFKFAPRVQAISGQSLDTVAQEGGIGSTAALEIVTGMEPGSLTYMGERTASTVLQRVADAYGKDPKSLDTLVPELRKVFNEAKSEQGAIDDAGKSLDEQGVQPRPGPTTDSLPLRRKGRTPTQPTTAVDGAGTSGVAINSRAVAKSTLREVASPTTLEARTEVGTVEADAKNSVIEITDILSEGLAPYVGELGVLPEAVDIKRADLNAQLASFGITDPALVQLANRRFDENVAKLEGVETAESQVEADTTATVPLEGVTTDTTASQLPANPATGLKPPGKRRGGRKPLDRTPEERQAAAERRKERQKVGRDSVRTADRALNTIEKPFNVDDYSSLDNAKAAALELATERRDALVDAFQILANKNISPDSKAKQTARKVIDHPSVDSRERTIAENLSKQKEARSDLLDFSTETRRDEAYNTFDNATQAINHIIKTGNAFESLLAKRIKPFLKGVNFVVVNDPNVDIPDARTRSRFLGATGLYVEGADGTRTIYLSALPQLDGLNNMTFLHEAVHGATLAQINSWINNQSSVSPQAASALRDMQRVMLNAYKTYAVLNVVEMTDPIDDNLYQLGAFTDLKEFVAYGLTQPEMQDFLAKVEGDYRFKDDVAPRGLLSRFVQSIRKLFNMGPQYNSAFLDLVVVTDRLLNAPMMDPTKEAVTAAAKKLSSQDKLLEKIRRSRPDEDMVNDVGELTKTTRNAKDAVRMFKAAFDAMSVNSIRAALYTLASRDIVRWAGDRINNLKNIGNAVEKMSAMRAKRTRDLAQEVQPWVAYDRKNKKGGRILADLMNVTTLVNVDPTLHSSLTDALANDSLLTDLRAELDAAINQPSVDARAPRTIRAEITKREGDIRLVYEGGRSPSGYVMGGWNELGSIAKGEGRKIFKQVKESYQKTFETHQELLLKKIRGSEIPGSEGDESTPKGQLIAEITRSFQEAKKLGVYFPLMRFGQHWLRVGQGKNSEYFMFESEVKRNEYARRRAEEMARAGETRSYEQLITEEALSIGSNLGTMRKEIVDSSAMLKNIFSALESGSQVDPNTGRVMLTEVESIKDQVYQMYLMTLPERDMRRRFTHRQGRTGFTADAIRTFVTSQHTAANQLARLAYSDEIRAAIGSSYAELAGNPNAPKLAPFVNELAARAISQIQPPATGMADAFGRVGNQAAFLYMLSSIKSALVQTTQVPIVVVPTLAAEYGITDTLATVGSYGNLFNRFGLTKYNDQGELVTEWGKPSINDSNYINNHPDPVYREALKKAWRVGDERDAYMSTYTADMTSRGRMPSAEQQNPTRMATKAVYNFLTGAFHHAERMARETVYMSAFEMEYKKLRGQEVAHDEAVNRSIDKALDLLNESMFDFTQYNKPRVMTSNVILRLATQFRSFSLQMTSYLVRNFANMLPFLNKEGKREAATKFFGTLGMTFAFAGVTGMPLYSFLIGAAEMLRDMMRPDEDDPEADQWYDEDDDGNPLGKRSLDLWFREWFIPTHFGRGSSIANALGLSDEQALLLQRGVKMGPISALTDLNIGASTTLNNLWFQDSPPSDSYKAAYQDLLYQYALGPFGSMIEQGMAGLDDFSKGDWVRGAEKMLPAGFRGTAKAMRQATEGERTRDGAVIREEEWFHIGKLMASASGFQSTEIAEIQKKNFIARRMIQQIERQRTSSLENLDKAVDKFDNNPTDDNWDQIEKALDAISAYNYINGFGPLAITQETIQRSLSERAKRRGMAVEGLSVPKSKMPLILPLLEKSQK